MCEVTDTIAQNIFSRLDEAQWLTGKWLGSWSHKVCERMTCARLLAKAIPLLESHLKAVTVNPTRCFWSTSSTDSLDEVHLSRKLDMLQALVSRAC